MKIQILVVNENLAHARNGEVARHRELFLIKAKAQPNYKFIEK